LWPGREYYLKRSNPRAPEQYWNEVLAHRLGSCIGIAVPPTHAAHNSITNEPGALSESFLHGQYQAPRFLSGRDILSLGNRSSDRRREHLHNFEAILGWISFLERNRLSHEDWREHWAKAFLLDTLLGNTDRHPENWGAILATSANGRESVHPAPLFDNGTSMGYEWPTAKLAAVANPARLMRYIYRGTHQMFWRSQDASRLSHPNFLKRFFDEFPAHRAGILSRLRLSDKTIERLADELTTFRGPRPLTRTRASFMVKLVKTRRDYVRSLLRSV
jgi:hypothetical protein